jgi:integrase
MAPQHIDTSRLVAPAAAEARAHRKREADQDVSRRFAAACSAAGYPGRIPHDLRRSAVKNMERAGLSRSVAMQLTGHKTEAVYRRYAITSEADLRR